MTDELDGARLIRELLADPAKFDRGGRAYVLLQAYFAHFPKETLRPLLRSNDVIVQRSAAFVISELGRDAASLVEDLPPLLRSSDPHVQWYAMEGLAVCSTGEHARLFAHVVLMLESANDPIRRLAMRLMTRVDVSQLAAVAGHFGRLQDERYRTHVLGLNVLAEVEPAESVIASMVGHVEPLTRRYGAIAVKRLRRPHPSVASLVRSSDDQDVRALFDLA